MFSATVQNVVA